MSEECRASNKWTNKIFFHCWKSNALGERWSSVTTCPKPAEVQVITTTLQPVPSVYQECTCMSVYTDLYLSPSFSQQICQAVWCLPSRTRVAYHKCIQITPITPQKCWCFIALHRQKIAQRRPAPTHLTVWGFAEPGAMNMKRGICNNSNYRCTHKLFTVA